MKKNNGNSGLYGRVTKKQMGGAAKPVGMSGPGFLAGEIPPDGSGTGTCEAFLSRAAREADVKRIAAKKKSEERRARKERAKNASDANQ